MLTIAGIAITVGITTIMEAVNSTLEILTQEQAVPYDPNLKSEQYPCLGACLTKHHEGPGRYVRTGDCTSALKSTNGPCGLFKCPNYLICGNIGPGREFDFFGRCLHFCTASVRGLFQFDEPAECAVCHDNVYQVVTHKTCGNKVCVKCIRGNDSILPIPNQEDFDLIKKNSIASSVEESGAYIFNSIDEWHAWWTAAKTRGEAIRKCLVCQGVDNFEGRHW